LSSSVPVRLILPYQYPSDPLHYLIGVQLIASVGFVEYEQVAVGAKLLLAFNLFCCIVCTRPG
jgi:hypothetical protein